MADRPGPILFFATGVSAMVGGIASANRNVLTALKAVGEDRGCDVRALVLGEDGDASGYRTFNGDRVRFTLAMLSGLPGAGLAVFDHVQLATPILALPRWMRPPVVVCAHGSEATWRRRPASGRVFREAELVLANSNYTLQRMRSGLGRFRGAACPLGLPPQHAVPAAPPQPSGADISLEAADGVCRPLGPRMLLLVARMDAAEREKGHRELMQAMPEIIARHPGAQLVFAGSGSDLADLRSLAASSPAASSLFLTGRASDDLLKALYGVAYAFAMPSRQEGFGLVFLEAMSYAKPCIACRDDGASDVVVDGETGILVSRGVEQAELVAALDRLLGDPALARRFGEAGWKRLRDHFSSAAHQARVSGFVGPLLDRRTKGAVASPLGAPLIA